MNRNQSLVKRLALTLIVVWVGGVCLSQEKPEKPQDGPRTSTIDGLWRQMGLLQRQIVGLEVGDANPGTTPRFGPFPGNIALALPDLALPKKSEGKSRDVQTPVPAPKPVPGPETPPTLRDSTNEAKIDQLWRQITELQKSILKLEISDINPLSAKGPNRESPPKTIPGPERPLPPRFGSNEAQIAQLWQQIGQLYKQIVVLEVGDSGPRGY